jgi:hypothetical protein
VQGFVEMTGYRPFTTFWQDFTIAEHFGEKAIKETFNRAFKEWKSDYEYLTELVMILNWKMWYFYDIEQKNLSILYQELFEKSNEWALNNLKGDELSYYLQTTD